MASILGALSRATTIFTQRIPSAIANETKLLMSLQEGYAPNAVSSKSIADGYHRDETKKPLFLSRGEIPCNFSSVQLDRQALSQCYTNCLFLSRMNKRAYTSINSNFLPVIQKRQYGDAPLGKASLEAQTGDIGTTSTSQNQTMTGSPGGSQKQQTDNRKYYYFGVVGTVFGFALGYLTHWAQCCRDHEEGDLCASGKEFLRIKKKLDFLVQHLMLLNEKNP